MDSVDWRRTCSFRNVRQYAEDLELGMTDQTALNRGLPIETNNLRTLLDEYS